MFRLYGSFRRRFYLFLSICLTLTGNISLMHTPSVLAANIVTAAQPTATLTLPADLLIGENFTFTATFDNIHPTDIGYGAFIDLVFPQGADAYDGVSFLGASYLGTPVTATSIVFPVSGCLSHPYARDNSNTALQVCGTPGDTFVTLQLPFGSFTPDQPPAEIDIQASISDRADVNTALAFYTRAGFQYGNDPLSNPISDPSIVTNPAINVASWSSGTISPQLMRLIKSYLGDEGEIVSGPNFIRAFQITIDLAPGQTISNLDLSDILPNSMQYVSLVSTTVGGVATTTTAIATPSTSTPGGTLTRRFASVSGTVETDDASMVFSFYVPRVNTTSGVILSASTGEDSFGQNNASAAAQWSPIDTADSATTPIINPSAPEYTLDYRSIAIQKHVINTTDTITTANDLLSYTLDVQISDYFAFQNIEVIDTISDGQRFDASFPPILSCTEHGATSTGAWSSSNYSVDISQIGNNTDPATNGSTRLLFRVSNELADRGASFSDGQLLGGGIPNGGTGAGALPNSPPLSFNGTTCQIQYRTQIQDAFSDSYPSGDQSVDQGDILSNSVIVQGDLLNVSDLIPNGQSEADSSFAEVIIAPGSLAKSIYAINGNTAFTNPVSVRPGDTVTYRLVYNLPSSDIENLVLTDYLPLPVFQVGSFSTVFDPTISAAAPPAGTAKYGPTDSFSTLLATPDPTISINNASNAVSFSYGSYDNTQNLPSIIDLLLTVSVSNQPFADGISLTNQVHQSESSTQNVAEARDAIVQIQLTEPLLRTSKGVVAASTAIPPASFSPAAIGPVAFNTPGTAGARFIPVINSTNLGTAPINSNLNGIDAGDLVTFAIVIENIGQSANGAYDITITDTLPADFAIPSTGAGLNLRIVNGVGTILNHTGNLFDPAGINLVDSSTGAIAGYDATSGANVIILTYDLIARNTVRPNQSIINIATIASYANSEGGPNFVPGATLNDSATVTSSERKAVKSIVSSSESFTPETGTGTTGNPRRVAIGEIVRYRLLATVPEGTSPNMILQDRLPNGLIFLNDNTATISYSANTGFTSTAPAGATLALALGANLNSTTAVALPDQNVGSNNSLTADPDNFVSGTDIFFKLGNIVNNDSDVNDETITIEFNALIDNNAGGSSNDRGENRDNSFDYTFTGASSLLTSNSSRVRIVESGLSASKSVAPASADAGDTVTYTIVITNGTGADFTDAFDVVASDILPSELGNIAVQTPILTGAASGANASVSGQTVRLSVDRMPPGSTVTLQYTASLITNVSSGQQIINTVTSTYTSLPGTNGTPHGQPGNATGSSNNALPGAVTGERIGTSPITAPNDLVTSANAQVTVFVPDPQKSIVSTSEADSSAASVVIGEIVRYRMLVRLAEGVSPDVQLRDNLPPGMQLLLDGSTRFAIVSNGPGISSSDAEINSCADVPVLPPMGAVLPCALSNAHIATGSLPIFMLGSITNNDTDADQEYILIEFNAMVENIGTNNLGTALPNTFNVLIGAQDRGISTPVTVTVAEPMITNLSKTLIASSPLAVNSTVDYRLSFTNTGTAPAYDLLLTDTLHVSLGSPTMLIDSIPPYASADTSASSGNTAVIRITTLRPGDSIQITLRTNIQTLPSPGTILNQVELSYSSLSGNNGTTNNPTGSVNTGIPGSPTGERTGILADPINDLRDIDTEDMPLGRIGDRIWFDLNGDGQQNTGEPGLENINVTIGGPGQDGIAGTPDDVNASTQTNSSGNYLFEGLLPGSYTISIDTNSLPAGMTISGDPDAGTLSSSISLTLGNAESRDTIDFGYTGTASLGDYVWLDQNGDGVQDIAEEGLANVMVTAVWPGPDGDINSVADNLSYSTATDANGLYNFTRLPAAVYTLSVSSASLPGGVRQSYDLDGLASANTTQITLPAQTAITTADFGYQGTAGLGDYVWYDLDGDGIADSTERGIPGVTLSAIWYGPDNTPATADDIAFTTTTDVDGAYAIRGLPAGNYSISTSTLPPGAQPSYDADGTATPHTATISLSALAFTTTLDFGYTGTLTIGDHVWFDKDNDGIDDGIGNSEIGLPNITVILTYYGPDGLLGGGDDVNISTQTDRDGNYSFPDLLAGGYTISVDASSLPAGLTLSADPDAGTLSESFDTSLSTSTLTVDFGYTGTGSLGDRIWLDQDGDGLQDATELGIAGVLVTLEWAGPDNDLNTSVDNVSYTTSTDAAGNYLIGDLPFGSYQVLIDDSLLPAGLTPSYDLDGTATAHSSLTTLDAANPSRTSLDFGYQGNAAIGDRVWFDTNGDGLQDSGEPGMGGIVVILTWYGSDGVAGGGDDQQLTTSTLQDGSYSFEHLPAGNYSIRADSTSAPAGTIQTTAPQMSISLVPGDTVTTADFGFTGTGSIGDYVWIDRNNNGIQNSDEEGLENLTISLYAPGLDGQAGTTDDLLLATQTSGLNGAYLFERLPAGSYFLEFGILTGYTRSAAAATTDQSLDSDADPTTGRTGIFSLAAGQTDNSWDAGLHYSTGLGDRIWFDQNANGIQDRGEIGIGFVDVRLLDGAGLPTGLTTQSDDTGFYFFPNLPPGDYQVEFALPGAYAFSPSGQGSTSTDSDADPSTGRSTIITLTLQNAAVTDLDAGLYEPVGFGDTIWNDLNNDGLLNNSESGIAEVLLELYRDDNTNGLPEPSEYRGSTISGLDGAYFIGNLRPGNYIAVLPASNFVPGGPLNGFVSSTGEYVHGGSYVATPDPDTDVDNDNNGMLSNGSIMTLPFTLESQSEPMDRDESLNTNLTIDFGVFQPARLGSLVWQDSDQDGIYDTGEPGVPNIILTLYDEQSRPIGTRSTDESGQYLFENLPPGSYTIGISGLPEGFVLTGQDMGDDTIDSDMNPLNGRTAAITMLPGDNNLAINAGIYQAPPTAIALSRFTARWDSEHVLIEWTTQSEIHTWGYQLYRSATGRRADAELITAQLISGQRRGTQGASYSWTDSTAVAGTHYSYWLVELESDGQRTEYGPAQTVSLAQPLFQVALPMVLAATP